MAVCLRQMTVDWAATGAAPTGVAQDVASNALCHPLFL